MLIGISTERNKGIDHPMVMAVLFYIEVRKRILIWTLLAFAECRLLACLPAYLLAFTGSRYQRYTFSN